MQRITFKIAATINGKEFKAGETVENLPVPTIMSLLAHGYAFRVEGHAADVIRTADAPPAVETAVAGPSAKKARK